jgi:hypothetical protein
LLNNDEAAHTVKGLQDGIISEALYYEVKEVLDGNKQVKKTQNTFAGHVAPTGLYQVFKVQLCPRWQRIQGRKGILLLSLFICLWLQV